MAEALALLCSLRAYHRAVRLLDSLALSRWATLAAARAIDDGDEAALDTERIRIQVADLDAEHCARELVMVACGRGIVRC